MKVKPRPAMIAKPTHTCFDDALDLLTEFARFRPDVLLDLRLVHAVCTRQDGKPYAHAWVEDTVSDCCMFDLIVDGVRTHVKGSTEEYHASVGLQDCVRYTVQQAITLCRLHGNYGPWVSHLIALCSDSGAEFPLLDVQNGNGGSCADEVHRSPRRK